MAKGKYQVWLQPDKLEQIINWAAKGLTDTELSKSMGISRETFYKWKDAHPDIADAIEKGRAMCAVSIENMLFKVAMGDVYEETVITEKDGVFKDGELINGRQHVRKVRRQLPPSSTAIIFYLKNKCGYRSEPPISTEESKRIADAMSDIFVKVREVSDAAGADS